MQKAKWHFITAALVSVLLCLLASCSHDADSTDVPSAEDMTLSIGFKVPTRANPDDGLYEKGSIYENYIDVPNGNYRIYFFTTDNKFIARFEPNGFITTEGSEYTQYNVLGKAPEGLETYSDFKVVVLANWPEYPEDDGNLTLTKGETTIADICNADWAQFDCLTNFELNAGRLIPFYGVHEYNKVEFTPGIATILDEPVTLLRAMAKVEVILEIDDKEFADDLSFSSLKINRYNAKGYCAPAGVFHQDDYDHNEELDKWNKDYVHTLHLVNKDPNDEDNKDPNDEDSKDLSLSKVDSWEENDKIYEKWIAYVPEYQNKEVGDAYSSIKAKFNIQLEDDTPHTIYFANYKDGKTDNSDYIDENNPGNRLNIERNNIYRFHVTCTSYNFNLQLFVSDWEGLYENNFEYGDGQFTTPPAYWDDEINNEVEF